MRGWDVTRPVCRERSGRGGLGNRGSNSGPGNSGQDQGSGSGGAAGHTPDPGQGQGNGTSAGRRRAGQRPRSWLISTGAHSVGASRPASELRGSGAPGPDV